MRTYHIHCAPDEQARVTEILRRYSDVIINQKDESSIGITIEKDDPEADAYYNMLLERINRELHLAIY
jgi:hypothetical protein